MSVTTEKVTALVAPLVERMDLQLYDVDQPGGTLRIMLQREGGVDLETLARATREISLLLDASEPVAGSYTLEVSSPGLERPLRTPEHFTAAVGERVKVKLRPGVAGERRVEGTLVSSDQSSFSVSDGDAERTLSIADVSKAHTVFEWKPTPKPGRRARARSRVTSESHAIEESRATEESNTTTESSEESP